MSEDSKKIYMWISVVCVTFLIGMIWFSSIKYSISTSVLNFVKAKDRGVETINGLKDDFNKNINLDILGGIRQLNEDITSSSTINTTSTNL